jgi:hypothetical protein
MRPSPGVRAAMIAVLLATPTLARAADKPAKEMPENAKPAAPAAHGAHGPKLTGRAAAMAMPHYDRPDAYSEDMVITTEGKTMVMKHAVDHGKSRMEMGVQGQTMITIQPGGDEHAVYTLMPEQKRAIKYTMDAKDLPQTTANDSAAADTSALSDLTVEDLGEETLDGVVARKMRIGT